MSILCLNRNFYAIHVMNWERAMTLLYRGHASVLDEQFNRYSFDDWRDFSQLMKEYPNGVIRTVNFKIAIPEIIVLEYYDELPDSEVKFTRKNIYHHYGSKCCYCGKKFNSTELNLDHVYPKCKGGKTGWENIVLSCIPCNTRKGSSTVEETNLTMHYKPSKPLWRPTYAVSLKSGMKIKVSWQKFIDSCYWEGSLDKN